MMMKIISRWLAASQKCEQEQAQQQEILRTVRRNRVSVVFVLISVVVLYFSPIELNDSRTFLAQIPWGGIALLAVAYIATLLWVGALDRWRFLLSFTVGLFICSTILMIWAPIWIVPGAVAVPNVQMVIVAVDTIEGIMIAWDLLLLIPFALYGANATVLWVRKARQNIAAWIMSKIIGGIIDGVD